jgi:tetratricopeptide (TPR) repeat protein
MPEAVDTMFEQAVEALRQGDRTLARDLLTRLLKANQKSVTYWIWMSATVDTLKERVYCLETVLKLDPGNEVAKRGLVLLGARPPEKHVKPFPLNRHRSWEARLLLANEPPRQTALQAFTSNPAVQLSATVLAGAVLIAAVLLLGFSSRGGTLSLGGLPLGDSPPASDATATPVSLAQLQAPTENVPTPLAVLLGISYTPTPVYVNTPRAPVSAAAYTAAREALLRGDWDEYIERMLEVQAAEPEAGDVQYLVAEGYRLRGECRTALYYYNESLKINDAFAPGYLGLARARLCSEPGANVLQLYELAQDADPAYGEVYLDRAFYYIGKNNAAGAMEDLQQAARLMPTSALVQLGYTRGYLLQGDSPRALKAAQKANAIDRTMLEPYYYLGRLSVEAGDYEKAIEPLRIYVLYETADGEGFSLLGQALAATGDHAAAVEALNQALRLDRNQAAAYGALGTSYLRLGNLAGAEVNFKRAAEWFPDSFAPSIGLTEIYYRKGTYGSAYLQAENAISKAANDGERALALYWRALSHEGRGSWGEAIEDWRTLVNMPPGAVTAEMRREAQQHLRGNPTLTVTPRGFSATQTPAFTTPRPGSTPTAAP